MTTTRVRNQYLYGANRWAVSAGDPLLVTFAGVSEETDSAFFTDDGAVVTRFSHPRASAVCRGGAGEFYITDRLGILTQYLANGSVVDSADVETDGEAVACADDGTTVYVSRAGGSIAKISSLVEQYEAFFSAQALGLVWGDGVLYALLADATLLTLTPDDVRQTLTIESTLSLPATYGLRDMVLSSAGLFLVGTDRLGNGSVVAVDVSTPDDPTLGGVDRALSPFIVLSTDGFGRIGTVDPQSPYSMPDVPWQGRTDAVRGEETDAYSYLAARGDYAEVWIVRVEDDGIVFDGVPLVFDGELVIFS